MSAMLLITCLIALKLIFNCIIALRIKITQSKYNMRRCARLAFRESIGLSISLFVSFDELEG